MLVYIRESDITQIMKAVDEKDIPEHLRKMFQREQDGKLQKGKSESHLYTTIKVACDADLRQQIGKGMYFDLVDHEKVRSFRKQKRIPFRVFKDEVAKEFCIPVQFQRYWFWAKRRNLTCRPHRPLTCLEEDQDVGQLTQASDGVHNSELKLFLEGEDLRPVSPLEKTNDDILLFFKLYDPAGECLRYVGRLIVKRTGKPTEILCKLNEMADYAPDQVLELYEEIKFKPTVICEKIDKNFTFGDSQLKDGDIICFQKSLPEKSCLAFRYPDVPSFLANVQILQVVHFRSLLMKEKFSLEMSKISTYDEVVEGVAQRLKLDDPSKIRLTSHDFYSGQPKPQPIAYRGVAYLSGMLVQNDLTSDILYYEVLDIPLPELQSLKTLKVSFYQITKDEVSTHTIRLPKQSTVGDVISNLKTKVELSGPDAELRLLYVHYHRIQKILQNSQKIENINDQYWTLRAEEIPEEEKDLGPHDYLIHVCHFYKKTKGNQEIQNFGEPFLLVIHEDETFAELKVRIQRKLQVLDEKFVEWKFAILLGGRPKYLEDSDILFSRFQPRKVPGTQYLGLEHADDDPKRNQAIYRPRDIEKSVKIN